MHGPRPNSFDSVRGADLSQKKWRRQLCASGLKLEVCATVDLINVNASSKSLFSLLDIAGHMATRRGPDVARGPDVVHHWPKCWITPDSAKPGVGEEILFLAEPESSNTTAKRQWQLTKPLINLCPERGLNPGRVDDSQFNDQRSLN